MHGMLNVLHGILLDAAETLLRQSGCTWGETTDILGVGLSTDPDKKLVRDIDAAKKYLANRGYLQLMDNLERVGVEQESVSHLQEAFALLADMVGLAYTKQPSPDAIARFKENADLLRWHCAKLGLVAPHGHITWVANCHSSLPIGALSDHGQ